MDWSKPTFRIDRTVLACAFLGCSALIAAPAAVAGDSFPRDKNYALSLYGGRLTENNWFKSFSGQADFVDSNLVAGALGWTFKRAENRFWSLELEGNVAKQSGIQAHWEFNALLTGRWHRFPWSETVATSVAFGVGPSYATKVPAAGGNGGSSNKLIGFSQVEFTLGPPEGDWAAIFRIHHRSTAWGTFGDNAYGDKGESNALSAGVRFYI